MKNFLRRVVRVTTKFLIAIIVITALTAVSLTLLATILF